MNKVLFHILLFLSVSLVSIITYGKGAISHVNVGNKEEILISVGKKPAEDMEQLQVSYNVALRYQQTLNGFGDGAGTTIPQPVILKWCKNNRNIPYKTGKSSYLFYIYPTHNFW